MADGPEGMSATAPGGTPAAAAIEGSTSISSMPTGNGAASMPSFMDLVPEAYRDRAWVQDTAKAEKPIEAFFKRYEDAQALIGKKSTGLELPGEGATPEQVKAFHKALGVPDAVDGYQYTPPDISQEPEQFQNFMKEVAKDQSFMNTMKAKALEAGITPKQFASLAATFDGVNIEKAKAAFQAAQGAQEARITKQKESFKSVYGDKSDYVERIAKDLAVKVIPENIRALNDPDIALFEVLKQLHEKVYSSDKVQPASTGAPDMTKDEIHAKVRTMRLDPRYKNTFLPGHKEYKAEVDSLYNRMFEKEE